MLKLDDIAGQGGEGLMLHRQNALYHSGRSDDLLKVKPFEDAEAIVIGYKPGKGKNTRLMGAIKVRMDNGKELFCLVRQSANPAQHRFRYIPRFWLANV
jgi:DNA ligase-1